MDEDEKALNLDFEDTWEYLGKKRQIGRTNLQMRLYLKRILRETESLELFITNQAMMNNNPLVTPTISEDTPDMDKIFEERTDKVLKLAIQFVKQIVKPITDKELLWISLDDLEELDRILTRRTLLRRGFTKKEILEMEKKQREIYLTAIRNDTGEPESVDEEPGFPTEPDMSSGI